MQALLIEVRIGNRTLRSLLFPISEFSATDFLLKPEKEPDIQLTNEDLPAPGTAGAIVTLAAPLAKPLPLWQ